MKIFFVSLLLILVTSNLNAQSNDKTEYEAVSIEMVLARESTVITRKPYGRNVKIIYDKFFRSYYITFYNEESEYGYFNLFYVKDLNDQNKTIRMRTKDDSIMFVIDALKTKGNMTIITEERSDGITGYFIITNAVKISD
ncbi:MAG: hypothetical protein ACTIJ9_13985 [Aequorivita sp.]